MGLTAARRPSSLAAVEYSTEELQIWLAGMTEAQRRLNRVLESGLDSGAIDDVTVTGDSLLPGWTRGHVLTHLARNADSLARGLAGAIDGREVDRYPGPPGLRDQEIAEGARRPAADLVADVVGSAAALEATVSCMTAIAWEGTTRRAGRVEQAKRLPWLRWRELELHHVDLDLGDFTIAEWSDEFVATEAAALGEPSAARLRVAELNGRRQPDPAAWTAATLDPGWCRSFTEGEIAAIDRGLAAYRRTTGGLELTAGRESVPELEGIESLLGEIRHRLIEGSGVAGFEGFPVERYSPDELRAIWWLLSCGLGSPRAQSHRGDLIGDVRDIGTGISGRTGRGYTSNAELNFHADVCDVSGLFFLTTAREGGVTRLASSASTHDRIAERRPDLLRELYRPLPCSWQGNQTDGEPGWYPMPVFGRAGGRTSCAYVRTNLVLAAENTGSPPLDELQAEAVQAVRDTASEPDLWVERRFEPGAMLFVHNHSVLHLRTGFVDWDEPERKRHLLRIWLSLPNNRRLPASFASFFGDVGPGALRGGYTSRSGDYVFNTD